MKIAVVGSRSFNNYSYLESKMDELIDHLINKIGIARHPEFIEFVSGGARGADSLAEQWAKRYYYSIMVFLPEWDKYGKSAGYRRNQQIVDEADIVVAFWDGESKGTKHSIDLAVKQNKPVYIYTDWKGNNGRIPTAGYTT